MDGRKRIRPLDNSPLAFVVAYLCYLNKGWALTIVKQHDDCGGEYGVVVVNEFNR